MELLRYCISWILTHEEIYINNIPCEKKGAVKMSGAIREAVELLEVLPPKDQDFAVEFLKKMVLAWDPDYTRVTPAERKALDEAEKDIAEHGTIPHETINWD